MSDAPSQPSSTSGSAAAVPPSNDAVIAALQHVLSLPRDQLNEVAFILSHRDRNTRDQMSEVVDSSLRFDRVVRTVYYQRVLPPGETPMLYAMSRNDRGELVYTYDFAGVSATALLDSESFAVAGMTISTNDADFTVVPGVEIDAVVNQGDGVPLRIAFSAGRQAGAYSFTLDRNSSTGRCMYLHNTQKLQVHKK